MLVESPHSKPHNTHSFLNSSESKCLILTPNPLQQRRQCLKHNLHNNRTQYPLPTDQNTRKRQQQLCTVHICSRPLLSRKSRSNVWSRFPVRNFHPGRHLWQDDPLGFGDSDSVCESCWPVCTFQVAEFTRYCPPLLSQTTVKEYTN